MILILLYYYMIFYPIIAGIALYYLYEYLLHKSNTKILKKFANKLKQSLKLKFFIFMLFFTPVAITLLYLDRNRNLPVAGIAYNIFLFDIYLGLCGGYIILFIIWAIIDWKKNKQD